jgi:hypothetical protein
MQISIATLKGSWWGWLMKHTVIPIATYVPYKDEEDYWNTEK